MNIEIQDGSKWLKISVIDYELYPLVKVDADEGSRWYQILSKRNQKIATLRIDGVVGNYDIDMSEHPVFVPDSVGFCWLGIAKAVSIPDGTVFTVVDA